MDLIELSSTGTDPVLLLFGARRTDWGITSDWFVTYEALEEGALLRAGDRAYRLTRALQGADVRRLRHERLLLEDA